MLHLLVRINTVSLLGDTSLLTGFLLANGDLVGAGFAVETTQDGARSGGAIFVGLAIVARSETSEEE